MRLISYVFCFLFFSLNSVAQFSATVTSEKESLYTIVPKTQAIPFTWIQTIESTGSAVLEEVVIKYRLTRNGAVEFSENDTLTIDIGETLRDTFNFIGTEVGSYLLSIRVSHPEIGDNFFVEINTFSVSDVILARDDGGSDISLGFGFGNPIWYGYYGSEMFLVQPDTLTAISVYIAPGSQPGEIHLLMNTFDEEGTSPNVEIVHSDAIPIASNNVNSWVTYELEEPLPVNAGRYVFAAGQDTIQGVIGFSFDSNNVRPEGFWIVSPVAGGGYPWANAADREALMIRPQFKVRDLPSSINEVTLANFDLQIGPNPFREYLFLESGEQQDLRIRLMNGQGRQLLDFSLAPKASLEQNLNYLPTGTYFLIVADEKHYAIKKIIKQ